MHRKYKYQGNENSVARAQEIKEWGNSNKSLFELQPY